MKNNYPIKYAVMPIIEQTGWSHGMHELEREFDEVAYIVAKCYLINERTKYNKSGEKNISYEVVFPFEETDYDWKKIEPQYNICGNCSNAIVVDKIFNTFQDALIEAENKNNKLVSDSTEYVRYCDKDKLETKINEHRKRIEHYKKLEQLIEQNTDDLIVGAEKKEQTTVIVGEKNKKVNTSLYEVIDLRDTSFFKVYSLSQDEYKQITIDLATGAPLDKYNEKLLMINNPQINSLQIIDYKNPFNNYNLENGVLKKNNDISNYLFYTNYDNFNKSKLVFYTLETYDDIIKSFVMKYSEDKLKLGNKVMALRLKI